HTVVVIETMFFFFFQAEDGIRDWSVTGVQTCALPIFTWAMQLGFREELGIAHVIAVSVRDAEIADIAGRDTDLLELRRQRLRLRSEERRVGKEGRSRGTPDH